jgi:ornithine cyclodeaminase/alanine dehydrogenase
MAPLLPKANFVTESTVESAVKGADVVVTCTPIVEHPDRSVRREWMKENVLCIAVDYDSAFCKEVMRGKVFVCDNRNQYLWTQAQGVYFQDGYPVESEIYADMGELCAGKAAPVREGLRGAVLMGIASHDVMTGRLIYRKAIENKVGTWVEL